MKIYKNLSKFSSNKSTFITIGTFDGVHIGHQKVIKNLVENAQKNNASSVLLTFFPHPRMVLQKDSNIKLINTIDERIQLLKKTGVNNLVIQKFTEDFAKQTALDFVRNILVNKLNVARLIIGYDHHFGKNREGNFEQLEDYAHTYDFEVQEISKQDIDSIAVSSTKIRTALENGNIKKANSYLGYYFMLSGKVVQGKNIGKKIGFPTANIFIKENYKLIPKTGAYVVKSEINQQTVFGMMNIGYRPTVSGKNQTIEVHFFDLDEDLYGKEVVIEILEFLRDEQKFETIDELKNQLKNDQQKSLQILQDFSF